MDEALRAEYERVRAANARILNRHNRQYLGERADWALNILREAYAADLVSLERLESVTEDIVHGRSTRLPFSLSSAALLDQLRENERARRAILSERRKRIRDAYRDAGSVRHLPPRREAM